MDDPILAFLDRICRTNLCTGWFVAMPADVGRGGDTFAPLDEIEVDHRITAVGFAFLASLQAGAATNAARRIDIELVSEH
jgi:hypothetical protein